MTRTFLMYYRHYIIEAYDWSGGFQFCHEDYDGDPDANDDRAGVCATIQDCKDEIDDLEACPYCDGGTYETPVSRSLITGDIKYQERACHHCHGTGQREFVEE